MLESNPSWQWLHPSSVAVERYIFVSEPKPKMTGLTQNEWQHGLCECYHNPGLCCRVSVITPGLICKVGVITTLGCVVR